MYLRLPIYELYVHIFELKSFEDRREMETIRDGIQALREQTNRKQLALEEVSKRTVTVAIYQLLSHKLYSINVSLIKAKKKIMEERREARRAVMAAREMESTIRIKLKSLDIDNNIKKPQVQSQPLDPQYLFKYPDDENTTTLPMQQFNTSSRSVFAPFSTQNRYQQQNQRFVQSIIFLYIHSGCVHLQARIN